MRKHFLLLFLMTLLPLAGWASSPSFPVDLSQNWAIKYGTQNQAYAYYTGDDVMPTVKLSDGTDEITYDPDDPKFNVVWKNSNNEVISEIKTVGEYFVTVTKDGINTFDDLAVATRKFTVLIATNGTETGGSPKIIVPTSPAIQLEWSEDGYQLLNTPATLKFGTALYKVTTDATAPAATSEGWYVAASLPKVTDAGKFYLWYRADADPNGNYTKIDPTPVGSVTINGVDIPGANFTEPTTLTTASFPFDNASHALVNPGECGSTYGTLYYSYKKDAGDYSEWSTTLPSATDAGVYSIKWKVDGKGKYNGQNSTTDITTTITAATPTITFAATQGKANLTYKADDQALLSSAATATLGAIPTYNVKYSPTNLDDNGWSNITGTACETSDLVKGKNAGYYRIEALVADGGNYTGTTSKFIIVDIQKAKLYVTTKAEKKVYGEPDPAFTIAEYRGFQGKDWFATDATLDKVEAAGFVAPTITRAKSAEKAGQNVGTYKISASGSATVGIADNYEFDFTEAADKSVFNNLTIEKKVLNKTDFDFQLANTPLTYDGKAKTPGITTATYNKYDGTHSVVAANLATNNTNLNSPADYAFTYQYNVDAGDDVAQCIITGQNNFDGSVMLTFDINKADIYVLPLAAEKNYGTADPTDVATPFTGEANPSEYQYKLVKLNNISNEYEEVPNAKLNGTVRLQREAGEAVSTYKIYFKSYTADANVADNYDVKNTDDLETEKAAKRTALFNLKKASVGLNLRFKSTAIATKVYGDGTPKWTIDDLEPVPGNEGFVVGDDWNKVKPTLSAPVFTLASENVSTTDNKVTVTGLASTNYPNVTVEPLAFTVTKRPIAITVQAQTRDYGLDPEQDAAGTLGKWSVDDTKSYKNLTSPQGEPIASANQVGKALVGSDVASVLEIELYLDKDPYSYAAGQPHTGVIKARITAENSNYELNDDCVWGNLTINPVNAFVLNFTDENLATKIATQAATGEEKPIMFGSMTLNAKEWYAVVLPFNTTPAELVQKLGEYVVVNKLSSSKLGSEGQAVINFSMEWDEIKAGEPFVIKASKEINLQGKTFEARKIFAEFQEKSTDKATFKGNYETGKMVWLNHNLDGTEAADKHYRWLSHTGAAKYKVDADGNIVPNGTYTGEGSNNWKTAESAPHYLAPMEAYLELTSDVAYARIFVEDFENGVTAIKSLSADEVNGLKIAEGWYTIDGIRLQSAPTQKGIYINNGKKVVVK